MTVSELFGLKTNKKEEKAPEPIKEEKKDSDLPICPTCKKCKDRSICKNRKN